MEELAIFFTLKALSKDFAFALQVDFKNALKIGDFEHTLNKLQMCFTGTLQKCFENTFEVLAIFALLLVTGRGSRKFNSLRIFAIYSGSIA